jgi:short-subunit dehydrogenase
LYRRIPLEFYAAMFDESVWFALQVLLLFIIAKLLLPLLMMFWGHIKCVYLLSNSTYIRSLGKWAIVTGATDGIGMEYADNLACLGLNLILISRTEEKLVSTAQRLKTDHMVAVEYIVADFRRTDIYSHIRDEITRITRESGENVGVLVNNVGMTQDNPNEFYNYHGDITFFQQLVACNDISAVCMSRIVLNTMAAQNKGLIINISSASSINPIPLSAMYSSSKRFLTFFSRGLQAELKHKKSGVQVHTVLPFFVTTKFIGTFKPHKFLAPNAHDYVKTTFKKAGFLGEVYGPLSHQLQGWIIENVPAAIQMIFSSRIHKKRREVLLNSKKSS